MTHSRTEDTDRRLGGGRANGGRGIGAEGHVDEVSWRAGANEVEGIGEATIWGEPWPES